MYDNFSQIVTDFPEWAAPVFSTYHLYEQRKRAYQHGQSYQNLHCSHIEAVNHELSS